MADLLVAEAKEGIEKWYEGKCRKCNLIEEAYEATDFFPYLGEKGRWLRFTAAVLRDSTGEPAGAIETLEDITEGRLPRKPSGQRAETLLPHRGVSHPGLRYRERPPGPLLEPRAGGTLGYQDRRHGRQK